VALSKARNVGTQPLTRLDLGFAGPRRDRDWLKLAFQLRRFSRLQTQILQTHAAATMTSIEALPRKIQPKSTPIEILNNDAARLYTHLHPVLLLAVFLVRFNALVADPVATLFTSLIPLSILQLCYVVTCLPTASGSGSQPPPKPAKAGQRRKTSQPRQGLSAKIVVCDEFWVLSIRIFAYSSAAGPPVPDSRARPCRSWPHRAADPLRSALHNPRSPQLSLCLSYGRVGCSAIGVCTWG
jgi:hypothetical protein